MDVTDSQTSPNTRAPYRVGEYVASERNAYPVLLEVIQVEDDGLLRVRGLDWPVGYSAVLA